MSASPSVRRVLVAIKDLRGGVLLDKAAYVASRCGAELILFHDLDFPVFLGAPASRTGVHTIMRNERREALRQLETLAEPLRAKGLEVATLAQWDHPPHEAIIRAAVRARADLIVAQCRPRHRLASLLRYTDWSLLRDSPLPVLLVKSARRYNRPRILAAVDPLHALAKPAGLDGAILRAALDLGACVHTAPHVVHAYCPPCVAEPQDLAATTLQLLDADAQGAAKRAFRKLLSTHSLPAARAHLVRANPVDAIAKTAREIGASIVVMGAISRRGLRRVFIGDTAERLLDELPCDVLVVKPAKFAARVPRGRRDVRVMVDMASIG